MKAMFVALSALCLAGQVHADIVTIADNTPGTATNDGSIAPGEYVGFSTGINGGFGNVIGSQSRLYVDSSTGGALNFGLQKGSGGFNDAMVIYIDSVTGGFSTTQNFTDTADGGRRATSGFDGSNRSTLNFASGFEADYAIAVESTFAGIFQLVSNGSHNFVASANLTNGGANLELNLSLANIGLSPGGSFKYIATYLNPDNAFRSDEFHGVGAFSGGNPGYNPVSLAAGDYNTFISAVPEVSPAVAIPLSATVAAIGAIVVRKFKRREAS